MRPGGVGLCAVLVVVVVVVAVRGVDEVVVEAIGWWCVSMCLAWPCSGRICVARQGCLLHTMQTGRSAVDYSMVLG